MQEGPLGQAKQKTDDHDAAEFQGVQRHIEPRGQLLLSVKMLPGDKLFQTAQRQQVAKQNAEGRHQRGVKDRQQIAAEVIEKRQADAHKEQDDIDHPAQQLIDAAQHRRLTEG